MTNCDDTYKSWILTRVKKLHGLTWSGGQFVDGLDEFVPVAVGCHSDLLQVLVTHLRQYVQCDLFSLKQLQQVFQTQAANTTQDKVM